MNDLLSLPVKPPVEPMLAKLARSLPEGEEFLYEPKWDGFRCLVFRAGAQVDLRSRHQRPLARYFPELVEALRSVEAGRFVLDGEIMALAPSDFVALLQRLHPAASRVERLRRETPVGFVAFDLLALEDDDLRGEAFEQRRLLLEKVLLPAPPSLFLTPLTEERRVAAAWLDGPAGIDGVMAKHRTLRYRPGARSMIKVKRERSADCVVAGFRWHHQEPTVGSLLLGVYGQAGELRHVGLATGFRARRRHELLAEITPCLAPLEGHPWQHGFPGQSGPVGRLPGTASRWGYGDYLTWVPLRPELVCEVGYDHLDGGRFRHAARFRRWRPDRDARSCTFEQFAEVGKRAADLVELLQS